MGGSGAVSGTDGFAGAAAVASFDSEVAVSWTGSVCVGGEGGWRVGGAV